VPDALAPGDPSAAAGLLGDWAAAANVSVAELCMRVQSGRAAEARLVEANVGLVTSVMLKLKRSSGGRIDRGTSEQDLMQEGCMALLTAAERFDVGVGCRFSTYATFWVRNALNKVLQEQTRMIRLPARVHSTFSKIRRTSAELAAQQRDGAGPTDEEVARNLDESSLTPAKIRAITQTVLNRPTSLDAPMRKAWGTRQDGLSTIADLIQDPDCIHDAVVSSMLCRDLQAAMEDHLELDERRVLVLRFGLADGVHRTVRRTGEEMGMDKKHVDKLLYSAMSKMRKPHIANALREYLKDGAGGGLQP